MNKNKINKGLKRGTLLSMSALMAMSGVVPVYAATTDLSYRGKVISLTGIIDGVGTDMEKSITRGEFSKMLVKASTYKDYLSAASAVSVYNDVPSENAYASSIKIAIDNDWMTGYLGGYFKPDQGITLKEAVRGILSLLGYSGSDITGTNRMSLYYSLELNEGIYREENEVLTKSDCVQLFYNLLKTKMKGSNTVYGTVIGCTVNSDGEINPMDLADNDLTGPELVPKGRSLGNYVPFNIEEASIYVNGEPASYSLAKSVISDGYAVIYYNTQAKTVWIYPVDNEDEDSGRCAVRGKVTSIIYQSADTMTPSAVILDNDEDRRYSLTSSSVQFAFSIYGSVQVGDRVTLVCEKTQGSGDNAIYTVIDYVED